MAPSLKGVMDVAVIVDLVPHGWTPRRKVTPLLLPRLGASDPCPVRAIAKGPAADPRHLRVSASEHPSLVVAIVYDGRESVARR